MTPNNHASQDRGGEMPPDIDQLFSNKATDFVKGGLSISDYSPAGITYFAFYKGQESEYLRTATHPPSASLQVEKGEQFGIDLARTLIWGYMGKIDLDDWTIEQVRESLSKDWEYIQKLSAQPSPTSPGAEKNQEAPDTGNKWFWKWDKLREKFAAKVEENESLQAEISRLKEELDDQKALAEISDKAVGEKMTIIWELQAEIELLRKNGASLRTPDQETAFRKAHAIAAIEFDRLTFVEKGNLFPRPTVTAIYDQFVADVEKKNENHQPE